LNQTICLYIHSVFIYALVYSFVVYSKTLSVARTTQRLIAGLANNEPEGIKKGSGCGLI